MTETPTNPTLKLTDIAAISAIAKEHGIPHAVDNTFLTPYYQRPIGLGADLVVVGSTNSNALPHSGFGVRVLGRVA